MIFHQVIKHQSLFIIFLLELCTEYIFLLTATWGCKHFTNLKPSENYVASTILQIFSLKFVGDFPDDQQPLPVYGFVAVRDDCEPLRNYVAECPI
jgi:hypothetical protein